MVDIVGHLGMALLWLSVGWIASDRRAALGFVALGLPFGLLPDADRWLSGAFAGVKHHGVVHTVLFVSVTAVVAGAVLARWVVPRLEAQFVPAIGIGNRYVYAIGAAWVGGLAHLSADILSAPDVADAIEPFWPLSPRPLGIDVVYYNDPVVNWGLFVGGVVLAALAARTRRLTDERLTRRRVGPLPLGGSDTDPEERQQQQDADDQRGDGDESPRDLQDDPTQEDDDADDQDDRQRLAERRLQQTAHLHRERCDRRETTGQYRVHTGRITR